MKNLEQAAQILKTMGHPLRLLIVDLLDKGELSVSELAARLGAKQSTTSQHLNQMKRQGILASRREGNTIYYSVAMPEALKVIECVRKGPEPGR